MMTRSPRPEASRRSHVASLLRASARGLATVAVQHLMERVPTIDKRYGPRPVHYWQLSLRERLLTLASAVQLGETRLFAGQLAWAKHAFAGRGVPFEDLEASHLALCEALRGGLPEDLVAFVQPHLDAATAALNNAESTLPAVVRLEEPGGERAARYLLHLLEGDRNGAVVLVQTALAEGLTIEDIYLRLLLPVQHELGRMWQLGEISVADEHLATATTELCLAMLYPLLPRRPPRELCVVSAAVDGNQHGLAARVIADFFEMDGWRAVALGSGLPPRDLTQALLRFEPDLLALSVALVEQLPAAAETIQTLRAELATSCPPVLVGGTAFLTAPEVWREIGADGHASNPPHAVQIGLDLCHGSRGAVKAEPHSP